MEKQVMKSNARVLGLILPLVLTAVSAVAAPLLVYDVSIDDVTGGTLVNSRRAEVTSVGAVVTMSVWAYVLDSTGSDDGFQKSAYSVYSSNGGLLGDLANAVVSAYQVTPGYVAGTNVDRDADGDKDIGNSSTGTTSADYATPFFSASGYDLTPDVASRSIDGSNYKGFKLATLTFTVNDQSLAGQKETTINFMPWSGTTTVSPHKGTSDGTNYSMRGTNSNVSDYTEAHNIVIATPEPATMALLISGGIALLAARKRRTVA
jgi:hypothetical protein